MRMLNTKSRSGTIQLVAKPSRAKEPLLTGVLRMMVPLDREAPPEPAAVTLPRHRTSAHRHGIGSEQCGAMQPLATRVPFSSNTR